MEDIADYSEEELLREIQERGYYVAKSPLAESGKTYQINLKPYSGREYRFGVVSDTHFGSRFQQLTHLHTFYQLCAKRKIGVVFHAGDLCDVQKVGAISQIRSCYLAGFVALFMSPLRWMGI